MTDEGPQLFNATVDQIRDDHLKAARSVVRDERLLRELEEDLEYDCERLRSFLLAAQVIDMRFLRSRMSTHRFLSDHRRDLNTVERYHYWRRGATLLSYCSSGTARPREQ